MITKAIYIILCTMLILCCKKDTFDLHNPDVDQFVKIVKDGNYFEEIGYELPDFTMKHIERLLYYSQDTSQIEEFPSNPLSSKYTTPKILGECLLWTIDGIRFENKYPSLEPCLIDTSNLIESTGYSRISAQQLIELAKLYISWWTEYKSNPSEILKTKNILENTTYSW
jgi:hypothetical protein